LAAIVASAFGLDFFQRTRSYCYYSPRQRRSSLHFPLLHQDEIQRQRNMVFIKYNPLFEEEEEEKEKEKEL